MNTAIVREIHVEFDSSAIRSADYRPADHHLEVTFTRGVKYEYEDVDQETFEEWLNCPSAGSYFHSHIRMAYEYHRLEEKEKVNKPLWKKVLSFLGDWFVVILIAVLCMLEF